MLFPIQTCLIFPDSFPLCLFKLVAAIIFISIGIIGSFLCAIVDGVIASEFIVSAACIHTIAAVNGMCADTYIYGSIKRAAEIQLSCWVLIGHHTCG